MMEIAGNPPPPSGTWQSSLRCVDGEDRRDIPLQPSPLAAPHEVLSSLPRHRIKSARGHAEWSEWRRGNAGTGGSRLPISEPKIVAACPFGFPGARKLHWASCNYNRSLYLPCGSSTFFSPPPCHIPRRSGPGPQTPSTTIYRVSGMRQRPGHRTIYCRRAKSSTVKT